MQTVKTPAHCLPVTRQPRLIIYVKPVPYPQSSLNALLTFHGVRA